MVAPVRTLHRTIARFVEQHRTWIESKRAEARRHVVPEQPFPPQRIELSACGESWRVHLSGGAGRPRVRDGGAGVLSISGNTGDASATRQALRRWLMTKGSEILSPMLAGAARDSGLRYSKLVVRRQRSRWGSCSVRGTISLNCCLLFQRPEVVRYLLIHELAHTLHMNHSKRFWQCVAALCPQHASLDAELCAGWRHVPTWVFDS